MPKTVFNLQTQALSQTDPPPRDGERGNENCSKTEIFMHAGMGGGRVEIKIVVVSREESDCRSVSG